MDRAPSRRWQDRGGWRQEGVKTEGAWEGVNDEVAGATGSEAVNLMTFDGYSAKIGYDSETDRFGGEILGLTGGADFHGKTPAQLRTEFKKSLTVFLEVCKEKGVEPRRKYSGRVKLRIAPELHEKLAVAARAEGMSISALAQEVLGLYAVPCGT